MCGIAGIFTKNTNNDFTDDISQMTDALKHRGPDAQGYFVDRQSGIYLSHRRLKIIDLSENGNQPMFNEDKTLAVVFNGEIYNHTTLRERLLKKGHLFTSTADTQVIVHGYEEFGTGIFELLDGDFAIAVWDVKNKKLILCRDRTGIKPLYYLHAGDNFLFASEAKSFRNIKIPHWNKCLNHEAVHTLLGFQYYFDDKNTIMDGIKKVVPGTYLEISKNHLSETVFWKISKKLCNDSYETALLQTHKLLKEAVVKRVLNCDVPQGILLSGGLDSSTVAAMAALSTQGKIRTFTAISDNKMDERDYAKIVSKHLGTEHTEIKLEPVNILEDIDEIIKTYDDLNSFDPGFVSTRMLSEAVKKIGTTVVLVGEGSDEVFGGYSWYGLSKPPFNIVPSYLRSALYYYILSRGIYGRFYDSHRNLFHQKLNAFKGSIFEKITNFELVCQLPNHFNLKVDKGNMSFGVEARLPFLDYKLVEYVFNLPAEYKLKGPFFNHWASWEKRILKDIAAEYLPQSIVARKKRGFMLSMIDTINANKDYVRSRIDANKDLILEYLNKEYYEWLFTPSSNKIMSKEKEFMTWRLFLLSVWYDYMFKKN